jgi:hypothetical protein
VILSIKLVRIIGAQKTPSLRALKRLSVRYQREKNNNIRIRQQDHFNIKPK